MEGAYRGSQVTVLLFVAAALAALAFAIDYDVVASTNALLNEDDPDLGYYNSTRADWSYDEYAILTLRRDDWFTAEAVAALQDLDRRIRRIPHVASTTSVLSVPLLRSPQSLFPIPRALGQDGVDLELAREELLNHTQARGNLISTDGKSLSFLVYMDIPRRMYELEPQWARAQGEKNAKAIERLRGEYEGLIRTLKERRTRMVAGIRRLIEKETPDGGWPEDHGMWISGMPVINVNLIEHVNWDIQIFGGISLAFFTLAFLLVYRNARWTFGPILTCALPVILVVGAMVATGGTFTVITSNLPVLLFVMMLPYTVYFIERVRERRALFPAESNAQGAGTAGREVFVPCLFSCTTTMAGFASLTTSGINPVRTFGLMMVIGMGVGLATVFLFFPALVRPLSPIEGAAASSTGEPRGAVRLFAQAVLRAPVFVLLLSAGVILGSWKGIERIVVETKFTDYFKESSEVYRGLEMIDQQMGGTTPLEVILESKEEGFFKTEKGMKAIASASAYFDEFSKQEGMERVVGNVRSLKTLVDEVRKTRFFRKSTVGQLAKIKAARELAKEFTNEDYTVTRVLVRFRETDPNLHRNNVLRGLREHLAAQEELKDLSPRETGIFLLYANMLNTLVESQKETFLWVLAAILGMLFLLFAAIETVSIVRRRGGIGPGGLLRVLLHSAALSAVVLVPQVLPALACLGAMGWTGIPLDLVTVMIASIAMGVGIDSAIQYTVRYRKELEATGGDRRASVNRAHATIGRAIWIATSAVVAGFIVLSASRFVPTITFGIFTALAMLMGQFASLTLLPTLFLLTRLPRTVDRKPETS